jgi:hypothetical protein
MAFQPQFSASAVANMTVTPITWNVVGLDSNDVNAGPNNFPVGARVCNTSTAGETLTNVTADFVWDNANAFINLRAGSQDPITIASLATGACADFYFEVTITRNSAAYDQSRDYRINVTSTQTGATIFSTPTPREIFVERLVSQNRNSVTDVKLDGVSIAAGGTLNLLVGNTYTIQLVGATATQGYEQIESFINFPNTIFQVNSVTATYSANAGTDPNAASKLYADGCGWVNDPNDVTTPAYRECTGTGKYGGGITITYNVTIIGGGGTNQTLNTLIYDFSGSSYHYNSDFSASSRIAAISDPSSCTQTNIAQWTFAGNVTTPSTGAGTFAAGSSLTSVATIVAGNPGPSLSAQSWSQAEAIGTNAYYQFAVPTGGYNAIHFNFHANVSNNAFDKMAIYYSADGTNYTQIGGTNIVTTAFAPYNSDLSAITALANNANARFRIYGFSADGANRALRVDNVTVTGCALPANMNVVKTATPTTYNAVGNVISYSYLITNTGGAALTGITLSDDRSTNESCPATTLAVGASMTCTATYTITQADLDAGSVTNIATADSAQTAPITDQETVTAVVNPVLTLAKTALPTAYSAAGDTVSYTYVLTNNGNVTLNGPFTVADDKTTVTCPATATLAPGASLTVMQRTRSCLGTLPLAL